MEKRSNDEWESKLEEIEDVLLEEPPKLIPLMLMKDIHLITKGEVTGKEYVFDGGGSIVYVDEEDAKIMLNKVSGRSCCPGSVGSTPYFSIAR
jgi:hypothetical protein